jgi:hypothetical protein
MKRPWLWLLVPAVIFITGCSLTLDTGTPSPSAPSTAVSTSPGVTSTTTVKTTPSLKLEEYDGDFFTLSKPAGWEVVTAGACSTFAFYTRDKENPANQLFYFGEIGPVYLAEEQKEVDQNYMDMGGYPVSWFEMPVINPLTPENFLSSFHLVAETNIGQEFMPGMPDFKDIETISTAEETTFIPGGQTKTIRALFRQGGQLGEGLFYITVAPLIPLTGLPSGGIGYGFCITGITAVRKDFKFYESKLQESLNSLSFDDNYINDCLEAQQQQGAALRNIADTLSETSDIIMDNWENRNRSDDIISEKRSDAILGYERIYDPETGTVYEAPLGFYDGYNSNRDRYNQDNLQLLPDNDWDLWTAPTEPAAEID